MKHIDFDFNGQTLALSFTMEAMLLSMEKYGEDADILETVLAPTPEGWKECCWMAALMAAQGELQRRAQGYDPAPMVTMEQLRSGLMAAEGNVLRAAVKAAFAQGMTREIPTQQREQEINLILQAREEAEKKTDLPALAQEFLRSLLYASISPPETP